MKVRFQDIGALAGSSPAEIVKSIVVPVRDALAQLRQAVSGNLTITDNQYAAIITLGAGAQSLTSGTEFVFQNPLKTPPVGFTPILAVNSSGTAMRVVSSQLNTSRTDGLLGVTVEITDGVTGYAGEMVEANVLQGSAVSLTSTVTRTITSVELGAGKWNVSGVVSFYGNGGAVAGTVAQGHIATAQDSVAGSVLGDSWIQTPWYPIATADENIAIPGHKRDLSVTTRIYLNATMAFSSGSCSAYGRISAERRTTGPNAGIVTGILWGG